LSRPKPNIIATHKFEDRPYAVEVCEEHLFYGVCYQGRPIRLRRYCTEDEPPVYKYAKTSFPTSGHAFNLAERLNSYFGTEDYQVFVLKAYRAVSED